jgi:flagellar biosynthesis/type III secretory pathway M-ring protein FliF/YscJ
VSAAIWFNPSRGDQLTVENVSFEGETEFVEKPTFIEKQAPLIMTLLRYLIVPIVFIILYLLFLRPVQKSVLANWSSDGTPEAPRSVPRLPSGVQTPMTLKQFEAQLSGAPIQEISSIDDSAPVAKMEMIRKRVVEHAQTDPEAVAKLVRVWLNDERKQ